MSDEINALHRLSSANLKELAASLRDGPLSLGTTKQSVRQLAGPEGDAVYSYLQLLSEAGFTPKQIALLADAISKERDRAFDPALLFELVLSGPDVQGVPTEDTASVVQMLIQEAKHEVLLVGYAIYNGEELFAPLAAKLREDSSLKVTFCLDIARKYGDTSLDSEIVRRFTQDFRKRHWPWPELPKLYYDPRSLFLNDQKASLHAKCVVIDRRIALITSANFTEAAQKRNVELGVLVRYPPIAERIVNYFDGLISSELILCSL